jgi:periplasmic divalent cation tolerance protein
MSELCEVVITAPDPDWLYAFARSLIEDGLAASAHNFTPVRSIYKWQSQVHERAEGRVSLHTSQGRVADIVARAKREHPYEVPGYPRGRSSTAVPTTSPGSPKPPAHRTHPERIPHGPTSRPAATFELATFSASSEARQCRQHPRR